MRHIQCLFYQLSCHHTPSSYVSCIECHTLLVERVVVHVTTKSLDRNGKTYGFLGRRGMSIPVTHSSFVPSYSSLQINACRISLSCENDSYSFLPPSSRLRWATSYSELCFYRHEDHDKFVTWDQHKCKWVPLCFQNVFG
mgnify:CR=1 FL=1